jgi:ABC-type multidrug transport system fused ATPase/permease subunit
VPQAISCVVRIVVGAGLLIGIDWRLGVVLFALLPVIPLIPGRLAPQAAAASDERQTAASRALASMHENIAAQLVVRAFGLQTLMRSRFAEELTRALTPSLLLVLDRTDFQALLAKVPGLRSVFEGAAQARRAALVDVSASLAGPVPL